MSVNIINVHDYKVYDLFNLQNKTTYFVPKYQREYAWGEHEAEALLYDLLETIRAIF